jgi:putative heme-binding domain-containing protein
MDDWGNWFGNNNPTWLWHYPTEERYIARNPKLAMKSPRHVLANYNEPTRVFPISAPMLRFNQPQSLNHVTSACSACPYRDELFGGDFADSVFISEPVHNVVHREVVTRDGIRFHSRRADDEHASEFLASTDNWFRPTMLKTGPDGALYIADMYRFVLEHPAWIAPETQARLDLRAGDDKGRIYRVMPENAPLRPIPKPGEFDAAQLVAALESPNGWQRMTAQQLLIARRDAVAPQLLQVVAQKSTNPKGRLHALCTLDGLGALSSPMVVAALHDPHRDVRRHALRLAESFLATGDVPVTDAALELRADGDALVRHQLALSLGASLDPRAGKLLAEMLAREGADDDMRLALLSSAPPHLEALMHLAINGGSQPGAVSRETLRGILPLADTAALDRFVAQLRAPATNAPPRLADFEIIAAVLEQVAQRSEKEPAESTRKLVARCAPFVAKARGLLSHSGADARENDSIAAAGCLGWIPPDHKIDTALLQKLLGPQFSSELQNAAVDGLQRIADRDAERALFAGWPSSSPALRETILHAAMKRAEGCHALLDAIANRALRTNEIPIATQQILLRHSDHAIRERAGLLFSPAERDRQKIVDRYLQAIPAKGDAAKGHELYRVQCATCHRLKGEGFDVGPDLAMVADKPVPQLVASILDPNAAIEARYLAYNAKSKDGTLAAGIIGSESTHAIVLRAPGGMETKIARTDLDQLTALGTSLMPEGLEQAIPPHAMADLLTYLRTAAASTK